MFVSRALMEAVGPYDENLIAEDFDMHLRLARLASYVYIDKPLFYSRKTVGNLGSKRSGWSDDIFVALEKHKDTLSAEYSRVLISRHLKLAQAFFLDLDFARAKLHFGKAIDLTPRAHRLAALARVTFTIIVLSPKALLKMLLPEWGLSRIRAMKRVIISRFARRAR
jgi:hypothetical protein